MATYKQRTPYNRFNGRRSPEQDSISDTTFNNYNSYNNSNININSTSGPSYINNPYDDILIDQEWTSIRQSTSARVRARQQQFLHQEQQRAQEWHFVLEQHQRRPSLTATITTSTATTTASIQDDDDGIFSDEYVNDISDVESQSVVTSPRGRTQVAMHLPSQMRGASIDHSSTISYSDLASESLDTLDESEDFSVWSQDDDESFSGTTKKSRHYIPKSPSTISLSSITSLNKSQMPFHDGSGNFAARAASQQGSDHESDHGGWESSSSTSSILFRPHHQQQQRLDLTDKKSISPTEFDSVLNDISNFQARHSPNHHKLATGSTETSNRGSSVVPQITISSPSPHARIRRPLGPSKLSTCSIYESEMEDIDAMVPDLPSKQGWLETFEIALNAIRSHEPDLSMEDSTPCNDEISTIE
ncbi:hypothetical protein BGZ46_000756 [Entomortierella lignicola]|nr:hypothetical protein BGZ46_000756 [Entomortierella lignicola]